LIFIAKWIKNEVWIAAYHEAVAEDQVEDNDEGITKVSEIAIAEKQAAKAQ